MLSLETNHRDGHKEHLASLVSHNKAGICAFWIKVVTRAAFDWVSYKESNKVDLKKLADEAYKWLFLPSNMSNSFEEVCSMLDLEVGTVRKWVQSLTKDQIAKMEHLERESKLHVKSLCAVVSYLKDDPYEDL